MDVYCPWVWHRIQSAWKVSERERAASHSRATHKQLTERTLPFHSLPYRPYTNISTYPYIAGHNVLLAHAEAVDAFRHDPTLNLMEGAVIGITNNCDWTEPGSSKQIDIDAATRANEWWLAWFTDPIWLGHYPASMVAKLGDRLPTFTPQEQAKLRGSADFFGLNHYGSRFARDPGPRPLNYGKAHGNASSYWGDFEADIYHTEEMPVAASTWLFSVCAKGSIITTTPCVSVQ